MGDTLDGHAMVKRSKLERENGWKEEEVVAAEDQRSSKQ
jgi:hypothetical protein